MFLSTYNIEEIDFTYELESFNNSLDLILCIPKFTNIINN